MKLINDLTFPEYPSIEDCILYEDRGEVIFQLKHLANGCGTTSKFMIWANSMGGGTVYYTLSRWDNTGGWRKIEQQHYDSMEIAKQNLIPLAKYFV